MLHSQILNFVRDVLKHRIINIYRKAKDTGLHRDPRVIYCIIAILMFLAGLLVGSNCFKKDSAGSQVVAFPIPVAIDQPQSQGQSQDQSQQPQIDNQDQVQQTQTGGQDKAQLQPKDQPQVQQPQASLTPTATKKADTPLTPANNTKSVTVTVRHKDNLTKIFKRNGLDTKDAKSILALTQAKALRDLRAGKKISLTVEKIEAKAKPNEKTKTKVSAKLKQLVYVIDELNTLTVVYRHGWHAQIKHIEPTVKLSYAAATVHGSVYAAASKQGISRKMIAQLSKIFSKKADLERMRRGDHLAVVYKEYSVGGKKIKDSEVMAAEISHGGQLHRMIAFTDPSGITDYYTPQGYNSNPPFARVPVNYDHISSRFSLNRYHPILGYSRPHKGVDFSAPHGTPIRATSNGTVEFAGIDSGYGRKIVIQRGAYKTLYAHLSKFANNIRSGSYVKKGETIGYVGQSGLATAPHLHYEFHVNGTPHDPLSVKLPDGEMIPPEYRKKFFAVAKSLLAQLDMHRSDHRMLAMNEVSATEIKESSV